MRRFEYRRAGEAGEAVRLGRSEGARFLAGGTNLVDLMKENVERPALVVDINRLALKDIAETEGGGLRLGALATNADTAYDPRVQARYPLLASAILAGASPQLRNAATNGGNLNQRTRCYYFYDTATRCNKREPGSGCDAIGGVNRIHAILGTSEQCIATHPSDMCVALAALDARVRVSGPAGERVIDFADYHRLPGDEPWRDNELAAGDLVTAIDLPAEGFNSNYTYLKLRDRLSYAFALVSVAVAMRLESDGRIAEARVALGGVAHKPWRRRDAESLLVGSAPSAEAFRGVAERLTEGAIGRGANDFKIELARRAIVRALTQAAAGTPQSQTDKRVA
jgi:xanthine dehydrogenase YagS FAD-binding subunit